MIGYVISELNRQNLYCTGKTSGFLRGGTTGAIRGYVLAHCGVGGGYGCGIFNTKLVHLGFLVSAVLEAIITCPQRCYNGHFCFCPLLAQGVNLPVSQCWSD